MLHKVKPPSCATVALAATTLFFVGKILYTTGIYIFSGDYYLEKVLSLFHLHRLHTPALFPDDYLAEYAAATFNQPWLYKVLVFGWISLFGETEILLRIFLPLTSFALFLAPLAYAGYHLGGKLQAWATGLFAMVPYVLWYHFFSSYPQAFALPLLACTACALVQQRVKTLLLLCLLAPLIYIPMAPIIGLSTALLLLTTPRRHLQPPVTEWSFVCRLLLTAGIGGVSLALCIVGLKPFFTDHSVYGERVNYADTATYPEADVNDGRVPTIGWHGFLHFTFGRLFLVLPFYEFDTEKPFGCGGYLLAGGTLMALCCFLGWPCRQQQLARLKPLVFSMFAMTALGLLVMPNMAYRFLHYPLYIVLILLWPAFLATLSHSHFVLSERHRSLQPLLLMVLVLVSAAPLSNRADMRTLFPQWTICLATDDQRAPLEFAQTTPLDTVFAAWPTQYGSSLPYLSQRASFAMGNYYDLTYHNHVLHMRTRTKALLEAYFATTPTPLLALHEAWGVDYLIYEKSVLAYDENPRAATYHRPFKAYVKNVTHSTPPASLIAFRLPPAAVALENSAVIIVDLQRLVELFSK